MSNSNQIISGTGMAVLGGIVLIISPWFTPVDFWSKLGLTIFGIILISLGVIFSKG